MRRRFLLLLCSLLVAGGAAATGAGSAFADPGPDATASPQASAAPGSFVPVPQFRAVDTRWSGGAVRAGHGITVHLAGRRGIPANAAAVAVTVHAIAPTGAGGLTVFPAGTGLPNVTSVSFARARTAGQAAVVRLAQGAIRIVDRSKAARTQIAVDVSGYYVGGRVDASQPGLLHPLSRPARALDATVGAGRRRDVRVGHGVPASGVGAVAVMLTAVSPARAGSLVAFAEGNDQPTVPTATFRPGPSRTTFAWVPVRDGSISIVNTSPAGVRVVLDVVGWTGSGVAQRAGALQPRFPARLVNGTAVRGNHTVRVPVAGRGGVPLAHVRAVLVSVTAGKPASSGALAVWRGGSMPGTRTVQFSAGTPATGLAEVPMSDGAILVRNVSARAVDLFVDVVGFVPDSTLTIPDVSTSRYLGDLTPDITADEHTMAQHGSDDAVDASSSRPAVVLLDVGAQSVTGRLAKAPGVSLTQTGSTVRLTYPELVEVLTAYVKAFADNSANKPATIAIGTNNDGDYSDSDPYTPTERGADWATKVVDAVAAAAPPTITIVGADDIEPDFASTQKQAADWEAAYLRATPSRGLIFNGSADGCPDGFGVTGRNCGGGFTQRGLYDLAHNGSRIQVLPQIYGPSQAAQWANIDRTGGGNLIFAGVLTEHTMDSASYESASGWAALYYALATLSARPSLPAVTDLGNG